VDGCSVERGEYPGTEDLQLPDGFGPGTPDSPVIEGRSEDGRPGVRFFGHAEFGERAGSAGQMSPRRAAGRSSSPVHSVAGYGAFGRGWISTTCPACCEAADDIGHGTVRRRGTPP
jgi:hypothetical protein